MLNITSCVSDVLNVRTFCTRCTECVNIMLEIGWVWENEVRNVLSVLNVTKLRKRFNEQEKGENV